MRTSNTAVEVIRGGAIARLTDILTESATQATIDAQARTVVYVSRWQYPHSAFSRLRLANLPTRSIRTLIEGFGDFEQPVLSNDGRRVLFLTTCRFDESGRTGPLQAYVIGIDGTGLRAVTADPSGVQFAILSGDGRVAFAFTRSGRWLRVAVDTGAATEILPRVLNLTSGAECGDGLMVAGSLGRIAGLGYVREDGTPEPFSIRVGGKAVPIVSEGGGEVWFQVPWEFAGQTVDWNITAEIPPGRFEQPDVSQRVFVTAERGCVFSLGPGYTATSYGFPFSLAANQEFTAAITPDNPAHPGDVVNLFGLGLGPVEPTVATGQAAPTDGRLSVVAKPSACLGLYGDKYHDVPVVFAGLAPGTIGIYQLALRIPSDLSSSFSPGVLQIGCGDFLVHLPVAVPTV